MPSGNRLRVNGGKWVTLPRYPVGRPIKRRCPWCKRECESRLLDLPLCAECKPLTKHADDCVVKAAVRKWKEHRGLIKPEPTALKLARFSVWSTAWY